MGVSCVAHLFLINNGICAQITGVKQQGKRKALVNRGLEFNKLYRVKKSGLNYRREGC